VDGYYQLSDKISDIATATPGGLTALEPCLASLEAVGPLEASTCMRNFMTRMGRKIYRRPLRSDEISDLSTVYQTVALSGPTRVYALKTVLMALLNSPHFTYRPEVDGAIVPAQSRLFRISPFELATTISFLVWGSTPDDTLLDAAEADRLSTQEEISVQLERMIGDPKARANATQFVREWLLVDNTPATNFSPAFLGGLDTTGLRQAMVDELLDFATDELWDRDGSFAGLMTSNRSFVRNANLAAVYGISPPALASGEVNLPSPVRGGLLSRVAKLNDGRDFSSPIHRGVFVLRRIFCEDIPEPDIPPDAMQPPAFDPGMSTRQVWTAKTSGASCMGCHSRINPIGFALEKFDAIGRPRVLDENGKPIDDHVTLRMGGKSISVSGGGGDPNGLGGVLAINPAANRCFTRQWFRFVAGRMDGFEDRCAIDELQGTLSAENAKKAMLRMALQPEFQVLKVKP
jgi:hypothetical protein